MDGLHKLWKWIRNKGLRRVAVTNTPTENVELMIYIELLTEFFQFLVIGNSLIRHICCWLHLKTIFLWNRFYRKIYSTNFIYIPEAKTKLCVSTLCILPLENKVVSFYLWFENFTAECNKFIKCKIIIKNLTQKNVNREKRQTSNARFCQMGTNLGKIKHGFFLQ